MQPYVTALDLALIVGPNVVTVALATLTFQSSFKPRRRWWALRPSFYQWFATIGSLAFSLLVVWVWTFVGSERSDGVFQLKAAWWLAFAFGLAGCLSSTQMLRVARARVMWHGSQISVGEGGKRSLHDVEKVHTTVLGFLVDQTRITFKDGFVLTVDLSSTWAHELVETIAEIKGWKEFSDPTEE